MENSGQTENGAFSARNGDLLYINSRLNLLKRQSEIALFENGVKKYSIRKKKKIFNHSDNQHLKFRDYCFLLLVTDITQK